MTKKYFLLCTAVLLFICSTTTAQISPQTLEQVTISAKRKLITIDNNKIIYDVSRDSLNNRGNTANAMRQIPGLEVSLTGDIKAGTKSILYLLNGQEDVLVSSGKALSSLPARFISRIELITDPDPKYKERGYDLLINLISKADIVEGNLGSVNAGADARKGYSGNLSFYHRKNSFSVSISSQISESKNSSEETTDLLKPDLKQKLLSSASYTSTRYSNSLELNYVLKKALLYAHGNQGSSDQDQVRDDAYFRNDSPLYRIAGSVKQHSGSYTAGAGICFNQLSKRSNGMIGISFSSSPGKIVTTNEVLSADSINTGNSHTGWKETILQGTFTNKINAKFAFDYGIQGIYRRSLSSTNTFYLRSDLVTFLVDDHSVYNQNINSVFWYLKLNPINKLQLSFGARAEQSVLHSRINSSDLFRKNYFNVLPRVNLSWKTTKTQVLAFSYRINLKRPSISYISPFVNTTNNILNTSGNPDLQPEQFHSFDLSYTFYAGKFYFRPDLYNSFSNNNIQKIAIPGDVAGYLSTYQNGGKSNSKVFFLSFGGPVTKWIQVSVNGGIGTSSVKLNSSEYENTFYTVSFSNNYNLGQGFRAQVNGFFNSATVQAQGYVTGSNMYSAGFNKSFHNDKSGITVSVSDPLLKNRGSVNVINGSDYTITSRLSKQARLISLNYFYKFGKLKETYITRGSRTSADDLKSSN